MKNSLPAKDKLKRTKK